MNAQLELPTAESTPAPPAPADDEVTLTVEDMRAWSNRLASEKQFAFAVWVGQMADAAALEKVPIRLERSFARSCGIVP